VASPTRSRTFEPPSPSSPTTSLEMPGWPGWAPTSRCICGGSALHLGLRRAVTRQASCAARAGSPRRGRAPRPGSLDALALPSSWRHPRERRQPTFVLNCCTFLARQRYSNVRYTVCRAQALLLPLGPFPPGATMANAGRCRAEDRVTRRQLRSNGYTPRLISHASPFALIDLLPGPGRPSSEGRCPPDPVLYLSPAAPQTFCTVTIASTCVKTGT
jgi:hypothetical protein